MASSKPLPDTNNLTNGKRYGQQHIPTTSSPLNPRSSSSYSSRSASLPRRHTVSGPAAPPPTTAIISEAATAAETTTPTVPRPTVLKHPRRHSGSSSGGGGGGSMSPTERLMRYKAALAWRSATSFRRMPIQGPPRPDVPGGSTVAIGATAIATSEHGPHGHNDDNVVVVAGAEDINDATKQSPVGCTTAASPSTHQGHLDEKAHAHVVVLDRHHPKGCLPESRAKQPRSPLSYHPPVEYYNDNHHHHQHCTDYTNSTTSTSTNPIFRRPRQSHGHSCGRGIMFDRYSRSGTTTTLQRASLVAVALLLGVYVSLHALSLVFAAPVTSGSGLSLGAAVVGGGERNSSWKSSSWGSYW